MMIPLPSGGSPRRLAPNAAEFGFVDLRRHTPTSPPYGSLGSPAATRTMFRDVSATTPSWTGRASEKPVAFAPETSGLDLSAHGLDDEGRPRMRHRISEVYKGKPSRAPGGNPLSPAARSVGVSAWADGDAVIDFNADLPYHSTEGHHRRSLNEASRNNSAKSLLVSHHQPQPMRDAPAFAPTVRAHVAYDMPSRNPYLSSVHAATRLNAHTPTFSSPVGIERPNPQSPRPSDVTREINRSLHDRSGAVTRNMWASSVRPSTRYRAQRSNSLVPDSTVPNDHDESGDDQDAELVVPPLPEVEAQEKQRELLKGTGLRASQPARGPTVPWQFHPGMDVPLSLLLQRGVSVYRHQSLLEYHMQPEFLNDIQFAKAGTVLVKFPRGRGMPHERFMSVTLMDVGGGKAAFLTWRQHAAARGIIDRVPLSHLVGVTHDDRSSAFTRFIADPKTIREKNKAFRRLQKPFDSIANPAAKHTELDSTMVAAAPEGTFLVGPTIEDSRRELVPRRLCFSLWFVNPRTREARSLDVASYHEGTWAKWVNVMRGIVAVNSVTTVPGMDEEDRRELPNANEPSMSAEDRFDSVARSVATRDEELPRLLEIAGGLSRTDELMAHAFEVLESRGERDEL
jgi:hypothetical protein